MGGDMDDFIRTAHVACEGEGACQRKKKEEIGSWVVYDPITRYSSGILMPASLRVNESDWASGCIALSVILRNGGVLSRDIAFQPRQLAPWGHVAQMVHDGF